MIIPDKKFWEVFKSTNGAFSTPEAIALYNICLEVMGGEYLELGTHMGKSTMAASIAMSKGTFYLVDPIFEDATINKEVGKTVSSLSPHIDYVLVPNYSTEVIPRYHDLAYVFLDSGDHGEELVNAEVRALEDRVRSGGIFAFHDMGNQFTAVQRGYDYLLSTGKYTPIGINWAEIFDYVRDNNLEEGNTSWHEKGSEEFPKFVGALKRK